MDKHKQDKTVVPLGAPSWITPDDIDETIQVWQPRSKKPLTPDDAVKILVNVLQLLTAMRDQ